jgi:Rod binding domain-containing protein
VSTPQISPLSTQILSDPKQLAAHLQTQRARSSAEEFEASLFATVLEKMEKNLSLEGEENSDAGHDSWGAIGVRAVSQALAQRHVLGIADMIEHSLGVSSAASSPASGTPAANLAGENKSPVSLMIPLKSSGRLPMNTLEGVKGTL